MSHLKDFIREIRACKTAAEEREVVARESADIRTSFKDMKCKTRDRNMAKLLFIHLLGYPAYFGQVETVNLIASSKFHEKRLGYLALMVLLDEQQDLLMLLPNTMKTDMASPSNFMTALALVALGNIGNSEMIRDLSSELEKCFRHSHAYIRKKATLCAVRAIRKDPDVADQYAPKVLLLLGERAHGVVTAACALLLEINAASPSIFKQPQYDQLVPTAVRALKSLLLSNYSSQHDVAGITDPFLQIKLLQVMRVLGRGNKAASDLMNDVLAQVATNTDHRKNAGTAVLYECVQTVLSIEAEPALRVLAVNILMRFLARNDNNTRYVALNLLSKVVTLDKPTVQRHKKIIVDCLNDPDISIRRRALELTYALVDATNCRHLVTEMVDYLGRADAEFKTDLTRKICIACEKYAPSKKWQLDTIIKVLSTAGSYVRDDIPSALVLLISQTPTLHLYAAQRLYAALYQATHARVAAVAGAAAPAVSGGKQEEQQPPEETLTQVAIWALGEYGDLLPTEPFELNPHAEGEPQVAVGPAELVGLLEQIIRLPLTTAPTRAYALTALTKLSGRFTDAPVLARITDLIAAYRTDITVELQQRACEYGAVLGASAGVLRQALVKRMPVPDLTCPLTRNTEEDEVDEDEEDQHGGEDEPLDETPALPAGRTESGQQGGWEDEELKEGEQLLPGLAGAAATAAASAASTAPASEKESSLPDLLSLTLGVPVAPAATPAVSPAVPNPAADLMSMFGSPAAAPAVGGAPQPHPMLATHSPVPTPPVPSPLPGDVSLLPLGGTTAPSPIASLSPTLASILATAPRSVPAPAGPAMMGPPGMAMAAPPMMGAPVATPPIPVYNARGVTLTMEGFPDPARPNIHTFRCTFSTSLSVPLRNFGFQVSLPKYLRLQMQPASGNILPPNLSGTITQMMRIMNTMHGQQPVQFRGRVEYQVGDTAEVIADVFDVTRLPGL
eukprot:GAFH01000759.1.p1 GENE.GAFH01000759.1~~GAFH01000759.1.p1  ORF type:complete len:970 (-),score=382.40 GAFH01000759.1:407-3289(-)